MNRDILALVLLSVLSTVNCIYAQEGGSLRERHYHYEVFAPNHRPKPKVDGWAKERVEEKLDRGLHAVFTEQNTIYLNWRLKNEDDPETGFDVYRQEYGNKPCKLNSSPLIQTTDFVDQQVKRGVEYTYWIVSVMKDKELSASEKLTISSETEASGFRSIILKNEIEPYSVAVADLNGDGKYDFVVKHPNYSVDPAAREGRDLDRTYKIDAYLNDGTFLWRNDLGRGIETGIWYSPFIAYDFNGDGRAEIAVKTAPDKPRDPDGRVTKGEEWISLWDGMNGLEIARADWPERSDRFGIYNRLNRNQLGVAYLDGKTPFLIVARGTYRLMMADAYQFHDQKLEKVWRWDGDEEDPVIRAQGAHSMHCIDVDADGRDEVFLGSVVLDDDGTALWSAGLGHPDKVFVTDIDPDRPGLEVLYTMCNYSIAERGVTVVDAATGRPIWDIGDVGIKTTHVKVGMPADVNSDLPGLEVFASEDTKFGRDDNYMLSAQGRLCGDLNDFPKSGIHYWCWWDADLLREPIETGKQGVTITKFGGEIVRDGIEGRVRMMVDLCGDWREELITVLPGELRIYSTAIPARDRRITLMQDPYYRKTIAHRTMGYPQPPVPSFYLGE